MYYELGLESFVDEEGNEMTYYRFDVVDDGDLEWPWNHGARFTDPPTSPIALRLELDDPSAGEFADYLTSPIPVVTERFRRVLEACGAGNVEYFDVTVEGAERFDAFPQYYAFNIVGKVSASDDARSEYLEVAKQPATRLFGKLAIVEDRVRGLDLFVLAENLSVVIVSERVKSACEAGGVDTLRFQPV